MCCTPARSGGWRPALDPQAYSAGSSAASSARQAPAIWPWPWLPRPSSFFRIGTGGVAGTYFPVGGMIANAGGLQAKGAKVAVFAAGGVVAVVATRWRWS